MHNFLIKFGLFSAPLIVIAAYAFFTLWHFNELISTQAFLQIHQSGTHYLFGKQYVPLTEDPKKAIMRDEQPAIISLGNSRSLQIREEFFKKTTSFFNYAQAGRMSDLTEYLKKISDEHIPPPRLIILVLDQSWFLPGTSGGAELVTDGVGDTKWLSILIAVIKDVLTGKIPPQTFTTSTPDTTYIGVRAGVHHSGFRRDGSYSYGDVIPGYEHPQHEDYQFAYTLRTLERGLNRFRYGSSIDPQEVITLENFLREAAQRNIHVVTLFPPFAPTIYHAMQNPQYDFSYMENAVVATKKLSERYGHTFYDFTDPSKLELHDEDFFDGIHWGETATARALLFIAKDDAILSSEMDTAQLDEHLKTPTTSRYLFGF